MKRKLLAIIMVAAMAVSFSGCSLIDTIMGNSSSDSGNVITATDGYAEGKMGDVLRNSFFDYSVVSAKLVDTYAGYTPAEGYVLLDAVVTIKNITDDEIPMFDTDFQVQWGDDADDAFGYPVDAQDSTMLPADFKMKSGESVEYHCVYEVPEGSSEFSISYQEYFTDNTAGDTFFIYFKAS